jgi:hypothetical protein
VTELISLAVGVLGIYLAVGVVVALVSVFGMLARFDPAAASSTRGFRVMGLPGVAALWPVVLWKIVRGTARSPESTRERVIGSLRLQFGMWLLIGPAALAVLAWGVFG